VLPTETVYGLGADGLNSKAVENIFKAKGRPSDNPLIMHISNYGMLKDIVKEVPNDAKRLIDCFWPGPLTIIFKKKDIVPGIVTCGLDTVAVRMPSHPIANALIRESNTPLAAPSANISGKPSTTTAQHAIDDLKDKVDIIIDGGDATIGLESTVVDLATGKQPVLLRPGGITLEQLEKCLGKEVKIANPNSKKPKSPGMKYRHYAPDTKLIVVTSKTDKEMCEKMGVLTAKLGKEGKKMAVLGSDETYEESTLDPKCTFYDYGHRFDLDVFAANVFRILRDIDKEGYDCIIVGTCHEEGIGLAIMNRLKKAAIEII